MASIPLAHVGGPDTPAAVITPEPSTAEELRRCRRSESAWRLTSRHARLRAPSPVWMSVGLQAQPVRLADCPVWRRRYTSALRDRQGQAGRKTARWLFGWPVFSGLASMPLAHVDGQYPPAAVITIDPSTAEDLRRCRRSKSALEEIRRCRRSESAWRLTSRHGRLRAPASVWMSAGLQARPVRLPIARCGVGARSSRRTARESARWMSEW